MQIYDPLPKSTNTELPRRVSLGLQTFQRASQIMCTHSAVGGLLACRLKGCSHQSEKVSDESVGLFLWAHMQMMCVDLCVPSRLRALHLQKGINTTP